MLLDILEEKADTLTGIADVGTYVYNSIMHGYSMFLSIKTSSDITFPGLPYYHNDHSNDHSNGHSNGHSDDARY